MPTMDGSALRLDVGQFGEELPDVEDSIESFTEVALDRLRGSIWRGSGAEEDANSPRRENELGPQAEGGAVEKVLQVHQSP